MNFQKKRMNILKRILFLNHNKYKKYTLSFLIEKEGNFMRYFNRDFVKSVGHFVGHVGNFSVFFGLFS